MEELDLVPGCGLHGLERKLGRNGCNGQIDRLGNIIERGIDLCPVDVLVFRVYRIEPARVSGELDDLIIGELPSPDGEMLRSPQSCVEKKAS